MEIESQLVQTGTLPSILDRISEREVGNWMLAKMAEIQATKISGIDYLDLSAHTSCSRDGEPYCTWGAQGCGECSVSAKTLDEAIKSLANDIADNPASKAADKRRAAKSLIQEAEQLEQMAKTI